jgi:hypothetical protein
VAEVVTKLPLASLCGSAARPMPVITTISSRARAADIRAFFIGILFLEAEIGASVFCIPTLAPGHLHNSPLFDRI